MPDDAITPSQPTQPTAPSAPDTEQYVPLRRLEAAISDKHAERRDREAAESRAKELETRLNEMTQRLQSQPQPMPGQPLPQAQVTVPFTQPPMPAPVSQDRAAVQLAAKQMLFDQQCNESAELGRKAHPDFDVTLSELRKVAPLIDGAGRPMLAPEFVEAALATGRGHEVLYALGKDKPEADRIMSLAPMKQAVELERFAAKLAPEGSESGKPDEGVIEQGQRIVREASAPLPIPRVIGRGTVRELRLDDPNLPTSEWMERRQAEVAEARKRGVNIR